MKATVYAVRTATGWQARFTLDWETDMAYWFDRGYRDGVAEVWERGGTFEDRSRIGVSEPQDRSVFSLEAHGMSEMAQMIIRLERQLPLGEAEEGCRRVQAKLGGVRKLPDADEVETMLIKTFVEKHQGGIMLHSLGSTRVRPEENATTKQCQRFHAQTPVRMTMRANARLQAMRLIMILPLFEGRSLLQAEAAAMLAEHAPDIAIGSGLPGLLQLGALIGALRLSAAVTCAEARGRRQRCRRCGSGKAALRRTACASCGSAGCAVCEACLALGRSRACGLLVRGPAPAASPLRTAGTAGPSAADICARWGLSPAQRAASEQAVRFLLAGGEGAAGAATRGRLLNSVSALLRRRRGGASGHHSTSRRIMSTDPALANHQSASIGFSTANQRPPSNGPFVANRPNGLPGSTTADYPHGDPLTAQPRSFLLWAVTGAGKTEMVFPLLDAVMSAGGRALLATPRRDVVLELAPRLAKAFPERSIAVLYGGSGNRWQQADLTLATTHQLMRFGQAFDLVLIDELDAFPYHGDPMLHYAAAASRKPDGATVLLSATPPPVLRRAVRFGRLPCAKVPVRYHRHPLPVPKIMNLPPLPRWIGGASARRPRYLAGFADRWTASLFERLGASLARGAQVFVFVPIIRQIDPLVVLLRRQAERWLIPPAAIDGTSSQDEGRRDKVTAFRERELRLLVTTTILERGVTVPRSDVFILDAHAKLFDEAALVQMAGRAGRSADDPGGRVYFFAAHRTKSVTGAIRQISAMNRLARRGGYLLAPEQDRRIQGQQLIKRAGAGLHKPQPGQGTRR